MALCDGENVWQYEVAADATLHKTLLLKLPENAHCPQWSPLTRDAILTIQATNDNRAMADARASRQLRWFDARARTLEDYTALLDTDVSYEPLWQREGKPLLAVTSARDAENDCGALTAMYSAASASAASSSVPGVANAAARAALTTAQNALRGGTTSVAITAQVMCRAVKPEPFLITPDGITTQLAPLPDAMCDLSLAPGGVWMMVTTGICRRTSFGRKLNLVRIDSGQVITVPLDPAMHSVQQALWQPGRDTAGVLQEAPALLIIAQRLAGGGTGIGAPKEPVLDMFWYSPAAEPNNMQLLVSGLASLDLVSWLADGSLLLVHDRAVYRMRLTDVAPVMLARLPMMAERCASQFAVSADERFILQHDTCDGLIGQLVWTELSTGKTGQATFARTVSGHSLFSSNSTWIVSEVFERYQATIRSRILLIRMRDGTVLDLGIQPSAVQLDWLQE